MTISELIVKLQELQAKHGDLPVYYYDDWMDFPITSATFVIGDEDDPGYEQPVDKDDRLYRPARIVIDDGTHY